MKHRQNTYTNKPLAINEGKHKWMIKMIIALILFLLANNILLRAEGTKSIAPSTSDEAALFIGAGNTGNTGGDYGEFAWKGSSSKLFFNIQSTCEKVYLGFSTPKRDRTFREVKPNSGVSDIERNLIFRIIDPQGNPINDLACFGNIMISGEAWQTLRPEDINLTSREITDLGPQSFNVGGYVPFELDLSACGLVLTGDYSIEFFIRSTNYDPNTSNAGFYIEYFDVTVGSCTNQPLNGRLWSNNWGLAIKRDGDGPFDRAFNGAFYICSKEGFITKIDFNSLTNNRAEAGKNNDQRSGFRAGAFNISLNRTGPTRTGDIQKDRQSVWAANSTNPELAVFLNLPDPSFCPPQTIGDFKAKAKFLSGCPGNYCVNLAFSKPGLVELLIEGSAGNRKFDNKSEVRLVEEITESDFANNPEDVNYPYEVCLPWSGKDGNGNFVDFSKIFISGFYYQGIYHFPVYDAEFNDDGFVVETVRPALGRQELFYDDQQILADNLTGENKDGTNGCNAPCHSWTGEYVASADQTQIFGNFNTINTWWFANSTFKDFSLQPGLRPAIICPPDYVGCPEDDISPNVIGNAEISTPNPECTVINYEDRILSQSTVCSGNMVLERRWSVYLEGMETERMECTQLITLDDKTGPTLVGIPADETVRCNAIPLPANNVTANDGCNILAELTIALNEEIIAGSCSGNYQIRRTWTATDRCGNIGMGVQILNVIDDVAPTLSGIPENTTISCNTVPSVPNTITATDNCVASADISINFTENIVQGACKGNYTIIRKWTASDGCGNTTIAEQTITVTDNVAPVLVNVPSDLTVSCDAIPAIATDVSATDNCEASENLTISVEEAVTAGNCAGNYTISRTWTVTDRCGNSTSQTQIIQVEDKTSPVLVNIPSDLTVSCDAIPAIATDVSATDNCEASENLTIGVEEVITAGNCAGNYTISRTWTVTDRCGNSTSQTQVIQVEDKTSPVLVNVPSDLTVSCDSIPAIAADVSATDNCEVSENLTIGVEEVITAGNCAGNYTISRTWTATDRCGNSTSQTQVIQVEDKTSPVLVNIPSDLTVSCDSIPAIAADVSATDNCEASENLTIGVEEVITAGNCAGNYTISRTWTATDRCGNSASQTQVIQVEDKTSPVLVNIPIDLTVSCDLIPVVATDVSATDNCEASENLTISFEEVITAGNCAGNYTISRTWTATDRCGNSTNQTQIIQVEDKTSPVLVNIPSDLTVSCDAIPAVATDVSVTDNCAAVEAIVLSFEENKIEETCSGAFVLERIWRATDDCGNQSEMIQIITVIDTVAPTLLGIPLDTIVNCHSIPPAAETITVMDNCSVENTISISLVEERVDGNCTHNFTLERTWTATDDCGNQTTSTQTLTVIDTVGPILMDLPEDITVECDAVPIPAAVTTTDNCEAVENIAVVFKELRLNGSCEGNYLLKRAWTATDGCGNRSFGEQLIKVEDNTAPVFISCPTDTTVLAETDCNSAVLDITLPEVMDNCNQAILVTSSFDLSKPFSMGTTIVIFTAVDECGNKSTCEFLVTVENAPVADCLADIQVVADCESLPETAIVAWSPPSGNECCSSCPTNTEIADFIFLGERGGHRYYYAKNELDWLAASQLGDKLGGYLVTIDDPAENTFLTNFLIERPVHIGLSDQGSAGDFYWQNESDLNYENWAVNEPANTIETTQFAQINADGTWQISDDKKAARFILEIPCMEVIQLEGPLNGSAFPIGTTPIAYLIEYDNCKNADTCRFDVTVDTCAIVESLGQYCASSAADTTCFWIDKVTLDQTENESGNNGGYGDFTNLITPLFKGLNQTLELNPGYTTGHTFNVYWKVWIDFNQDGIFDSEELVFTTKEYRPITVNFTIPATAKLGHTRMRISLNFVDENDPCSLLAFGEVEDYLVDISDIIDPNLSPSESEQTTSFQVVDAGIISKPVIGLTPMDVVVARQTQLVVYPNPTKSKLTIQIKGYNPTQIATNNQNPILTIYNHTGQRVERIKLEGNTLKNREIDVSNLPQGIYVVQIQFGLTKTLKQKFLKMEE